MSAIVSLRTAIKAAAISAGITGDFRMGYIQDFMTGQTNYPALLLLPPDSKVPELRRWDSQNMEVKYFIFKLDSGASGDHTTDEERAVKWGEIDAINKAIINALMVDPSQIQVISGVDIKRNSDSDILPDKVIWIEVTVTLRVYDC